ncbi:hypothetical protein BH11MYX3_BH11MYX3_45690 [soil metagenome]
MKLILLAGLVGLVGACGDDGAKLPDAAVAADANLAIDAAPARETIIATQPLQPGELVEAIMHGGPGDTALLHLSAPTATMDWNIHSHASGHAVTVYEELGKLTVDYPFTPGANGDWFLLIRNSGTVDMSVQVDAKLYGAMTWAWQ